MTSDLARTPFCFQKLTGKLGTTSAKKLARIGLITVSDLLWHVPFRLADPGELMSICQLTPETRAVIDLEIIATSSRVTRSGLTLVEIRATDGAQLVIVSYFARGRGMKYYYEKRFPPGLRAFFAGAAKFDSGNWRLTHPESYPYQGNAQRAVQLQEASRIRPVYHAASGISSAAIATAVEVVLTSASPEDIPEIVPESVRKRLRMAPLLETFRKVHLLTDPTIATEVTDKASHYRALKQLKLAEAYLLQVLLAQRRTTAQQLSTRAWPHDCGDLVARFDGALPFQLTAGQLEVGHQISADLASATPMLRLLQGDVGSGKTIVALRAMLQVVQGGGQAVLLAPTEVLAFQHYRTIVHLLGALEVQVNLVTGSQTGAIRRASRMEVAAGIANIVVGTHALFSDDVAFADLGLVVVDEQHRFGVQQRDRLRHGPTGPAHILHMTATPIPRTIALTVFGDLVTSTLGEVPAGRAEVQTHRVQYDNERWLARMWQRAAEEIAAGGRGFVVCPRIVPDDEAGLENDRTEDCGPDSELVGDLPDASETAAGQSRALASVTQVAAELGQRPEFSTIPIGQLHGRLKAAQKDDVMAAFSRGQTPILVATTVIEVGVDVPDATFMIILDADRFGLAQLHQLRGRIGRGTKPGLCFVVSGPPSDGPIDRLGEFCATTDGFALAEVDLAARREGDVLGRYQTGRRNGLRVLSVVSDRKLIEAVRELAQETNETEITKTPGLRQALLELAAEGEYLERT